MFDIGFSELLLILGLGLLILGPERLPGAVRTALYWFRKARAGIDDARMHIERELNTDEMQKNINNYNNELEKLNHSIADSAEIDSVNESISKTYASSKTAGGQSKAGKTKARKKPHSTAKKQKKQ